MAKHRELTCILQHPSGATFSTKSKPKLYEHWRTDHKLTAKGPDDWVNEQGVHIREDELVKVEGSTRRHTIKISPGFKAIAETAQSYQGIQEVKTRLRKALSLIDELEKTLASV